MVGATTVLTLAMVKFRKGGIGKLSALPPPTPAATKPTPAASAGAAPAVAAASPLVVAASHQSTVSKTLLLIRQQNILEATRVCSAKATNPYSLCYK